MTEVSNEKDTFNRKERKSESQTTHSSHSMAARLILRLYNKFVILVGGLHFVNGYKCIAQCII